MAVQAQMYPENLGMPLFGSQDWDDDGGGLMKGDDFVPNLQNLKRPQQLQHWQQTYRHQQQRQQQQFLLPQQLQTQQQGNQCLAFDNNFVFSAMNSQPTTTTTALNHNNNNIQMGLSHSVAAQVERQRQEIERNINLQSQTLKLALQEQRKHELATLFRKLEAKAGIFLRQKDEEIAQAKKKTMEFEDFMSRMEMENQSWKRVAYEKEAMIADLNNSIQQLREKAADSFQQQEQPCNGAVECAESCCHVNNGGGEEEKEEEENKMGMACRSCRCRNSSVLLLPCRHLCCCKTCVALLDVCPVCKSPKKGSIEALIC